MNRDRIKFLSFEAPDDAALGALADLLAEKDTKPAPRPQVPVLRLIERTET